MVPKEARIEVYSNRGLAKRLTLNYTVPVVHMCTTSGLLACERPFYLPFAPATLCTEEMGVDLVPGSPSLPAARVFL